MGAVILGLFTGFYRFVTTIVVTDLENADSGESVVGYHKRFYRISLFLARAKGLPVRTPKIFEQFYGITRIFRKY